jgi:hypothetical protein
MAGARETTVDADKNEVKKQRGAAHRHVEVKMLALEQRRELAAEILADGLVCLLATNPKAANLDVEVAFPEPAAPVGVARCQPKGRRRGQ